MLETDQFIHLHPATQTTTFTICRDPKMKARQLLSLFLTAFEQEPHPCVHLSLEQMRSIHPLPPDTVWAMEREQGQGMDVDGHGQSGQDNPLSEDEERAPRYTGQTLQSWGQEEQHRETQTGGITLCGMKQEHSQASNTTCTSSEPRLRKVAIKHNKSGREVKDILFPCQAGCKPGTSHRDLSRCSA